jgi:regulator of replication initiation timing
MSVDLPADRLELDALRDKVAVMSDENKYLNDQNDDLVESNGHLAIEIEDTKKKLALAEERAQKYFDFWRSAEEELTRQLELNDELKQQLEAVKAEASKASN